MENAKKNYDCRVCVYKEKLAPMCGFCRMKILDEVEEEKHGNKQDKPKSAE